MAQRTYITKEVKSTSISPDGSLSTSSEILPFDDSGNAVYFRHLNRVISLDGHMTVFDSEEEYNQYILNHE
jgi:hypothetical protein